MLSFLLAISDLADHDKILYVYNTYHTTLVKYARNILRGSSKTMDEEDAVQNMYVSLIKYIHNIKCWDDERQLKAYLLTMTLHECNRLQKKSFDYENMDDFENVLVSDEDFVRAVNNSDDYQRVVRLISEMEEKYSIPMHLRWVEELDVKTIAQRLELPVKTVYTRLERGKLILMKLLEKEGDHAAS